MTFYWCSIVTNRFLRYFTLKCCDVENRVRGPSRTLEMSLCDTAHTTSYWRSIVTMALSRAVSEIFTTLSTYCTEYSVQWIFTALSTQWLSAVNIQCCAANYEIFSEWVLQCSEYSVQWVFSDVSTQYSQYWVSWILSAVTQCSEYSVSIQYSEYSVSWVISDLVQSIFSEWVLSVVSIQCSEYSFSVVSDLWKIQRIC